MLRLGILGAARITPFAVVRPARAVPEVSLYAVAARDPARARAFAKRHRIPRVHTDYASLLADSDVDAVYIPLPNSHHAHWTLKALQAGKHVLCEKPLAANAEEAERVAQAAQQSGRVVMEAFHWRHTALMSRVCSLVLDGALGKVQRIETAVCMPVPWLPGDIRYQLELAGGALMDLGSHAVAMLRALHRQEPHVTHALIKEARPGVDRFARAELAFDDGAVGLMECSLWSAHLLDARIRVVGERGELRVLNPLFPNLFHRLTLTVDGRTTTEHVDGAPPYVAQLRAFEQACLHGGPLVTSAADGVKNQRVIDAIYTCAGLPLRPGLST